MVDKTGDVVERIGVLRTVIAGQIGSDVVCHIALFEERVQTVALNHQQILRLNHPLNLQQYHLHH